MIIFFASNFAILLFFIMQQHRYALEFGCGLIIINLTHKKTFMCKI